MDCCKLCGEQDKCYRHLLIKVASTKIAIRTETKEPKGKCCPEHLMIVFFQRVCLQHCDPAFPESVVVTCGPEVNGHGHLEALDTSDGKS